MKQLHILLLTMLFLVLTACAATTGTPTAETGGNNTDVAAPTVAATNTTDSPTESAATATSGSTATATTGAQSVEDEAVLQNLEYNITSLDTVVTLKDGVSDNSDDMIYVSYISSTFADVNGDGVNDAIVLLGANGGGSGIFTDLAIVSADESGTPQNIATITLGDRVDVRDVSVEDGNIVINLIMQGPNEPMCCGTLNATATYALQDGELTQTDFTQNGYLNGVENFYDPATYNNASIDSSIIPSGTITLVDGAFEDDAAMVIAKLDTSKIQFGDLNGDQSDETVLLLHANTGGSGTFTELVVMGATDEGLYTIANTLLGDRVTVYSVLITDTDTIVVDMLTQGPEDAFCCPTLRINAEFVLNGETLEATNVTEVGTIPAPGTSNLSSDSLTADVTGVADSIESIMVRYAPPLEGPGLYGMPEHLVSGFNGETVTEFSPYFAQVRVFPVAQYREMYDNLDNPAISDYIDALTAQIEGKSTDLPADMSSELPFLPVLPAAQDIAANVKYLDFEGGSGYRFIAHYGQDVGAYLSGDIFYTYQGLTADGQYLIVVMVPLQTTALPATYDEVPQEVMDNFGDATAFETYRQATIATLNDLPADQFTPNLDALDAMVQSFVLTPVAAE